MTSQNGRGPKQHPCRLPNVQGNLTLLQKVSVPVDFIEQPSKRGKADIGQMDVSTGTKWTV